MFRLRRGDQLLVSAYSSVAGAVLAIYYRIRDQQGVINDPILGGTIVTTSNRAAVILNPQPALVDGGLFSVDVVQIGGTTLIRGQCFVRVDIVRAISSTNIPMQNIIANYVTSTNPITYPTTPIINSVDGIGFVNNLTVGLTAGNANISIAMPTNARGRIVGISSLLTTNATAGNRTLYIYGSVGGNVIFQVESPIIQTAGIGSRGYIMGDYAQSTAVSAVGVVYIKLPLQISADSGFTFSQWVLNGLAGDSHSLSVSYEELLQI